MDSPILWSLPSAKRAVPKIDKKIIMPKYKRKETSLSQQVKNDLLDGKIIYVDEVPLCRKYVSKIVSQIRKLGIRVDTHKQGYGAKSGVSYRVSEQ